MNLSRRRAHTGAQFLVVMFVILALVALLRSCDNRPPPDDEVLDYTPHGPG